MIEEKIYYVYEWFNAENNEIFYVGKGCGDRYKQSSPSKRNRYFCRYLHKHKRCSSRIIKNNLTEREALELEHQIILQYKAKGYQLTNFDDGGRNGGKCVGKANGMYGKTHTPEAIAKIKEANSHGKNAGENNSQWNVSPRDRMDSATYAQWRDKQRRRKFGSSNPNAHPVLLMDLEHKIIQIFGTTTDCATWLVNHENLANGVNNVRSQIKYYSKNGHCMLHKYYIRIIRPNNIDNTVPSLCKEEG